MLTLSGIVARACLYCSSALAVLAATTWNPGWSLHAQNAQNQANEKTAEVTETQPGFKLQVQRNVVPVRVIVRDSKGRAVAGLRQEDFKLFDNRHLQVVTSFSAEAASAPKGATRKPAALDVPMEGEEAPASPAPSIFLALYFDDLNSSFESLARSRIAAEKFLAGLPATERVAIFTSSGTPTLDFTDDRQKLSEVLSKLQPRSRVNARANCPEISDYMAEAITNLEDRNAIRVATDDAINHCRISAESVTKEWVVTQARSALEGYTLQARQTPENLKNVIRRVATMPGERQVLLVSDGFLPLEMRSLLGDAIDRALRAQVMISALDAKGLVVISRTADASRRYFPGIELAALYDLFDAARESAASGVLGEIADSTGGQFFHNNNDLDAGFQKVLASPEVIYTLTFSPQNLKYNGAFHSIKVELVNRNGLTVQARKGYFAPAGLLDRKKQAEEEIQQAAFSREEINELTLGVQTQFFKTSAEDARITVVAHLDASTLAFRDESGLHITSISFVTLLFDRDGNLITGNQKDVDLRLGDPALAHVRQSGITVKIPLKVKVGAYTVRVVARGSEGGQLAALSKPVEIPF